MPGQTRQTPEASAPAGPAEGTTTPATDPSGGRGNAALQEQIAEASKLGGDDDFVRDTIGPAHLAMATPGEKAGMIVNLLDGDTGDEDEAQILEILDSGNASATFSAIERMGHLEWLFDDVNGEEHERLKSLYGLAKYDEELAARPDAPAAEQAPAPAVGQAAAPEAAPAAAPAEEAAAPEPELSEDRKAMLELADERMGSVRGERGQKIGYDEKKKRDIYTTKKGAAPTRANGEEGVNLFDGTQYQEEGTSCGLLPATLFKRMAVDKNAATEAMVNYGVKGVEDAAKQLKVWVESTGTNLPLPGDVYVLRALGGSYQHVGVVKRAGPDSWETADAGQAGGFVANYVDRKILTKEEMEEKGLGPGTYMAPNEELGGEKIRRVSGWVDLDALMARVRSGK
jgi:hypothetical protein